MNELMGKNMMRSDGDEHRKERFVYYPAVSPKTVKASWADQFNKLADVVLDSLAESNRKGDLVVGYATALSGEALKVMTGLTNISYQDMDAWSQAMIDGVSNYGGDPEREARCRQATAAIDAAIDAACAKMGKSREQLASVL